MSVVATALTAGLFAFAATNVDDFVVLLVFFSQVDANFRPRHIVVGQYLGFTVIILASLPGFFGGLVVPSEWMGLLGLLPIIIGIKQLVWRENTTEVQTINNDFKQGSPSHPILSFLFSVLHPQTYQVTAITIANGGDNISIYLPLFAGSSLVGLGIILGVFFFLLGVWCGVAYLLSRQPTIAKVLSRYGKAIVPFVLIGLGLYIMYDRGTFRLLG